MKTSFVSELAIRFSENPLLTPKDIESTSSTMTVVGLMNPAAFKFEKKNVAADKSSTMSNSGCS